MQDVQKQLGYWIIIQEISQNVKYKHVYYYKNKTLCTCYQHFYVPTLSPLRLIHLFHECTNNILKECDTMQLKLPLHIYNNIVISVELFPWWISSERW